MLSCRFLGLNFMVPNSWFGYQNVRTEEYEDEKSPLSMEGFGQAISLFLVSFVFIFWFLSLFLFFFSKVLIYMIHGMLWNMKRKARWTDQKNILAVVLGNSIQCAVMGMIIVDDGFKVLQ